MIKFIMQEKDIKSIRDLDRITGVSNTYLGQLINDRDGKMSPTLDMIATICSKTDFPLSKFLKSTGYINLDIDKETWDPILISNQMKSIQKAELANSTEERKRTLKLFEQSVCAGNGDFIYDNPDFQLIEFSNPPKTANFCIKIQGNSMIPMIENDEIVYVQERDKTNLLPGDIGIFCYQGDFYCKVFNYKSGNIVLSSYNPRYQDITINSPEELNIIGRVL